MVISNKHKYIYIANPKTGTTSVERLLVNDYAGSTRHDSSEISGKHAGSNWLIQHTPSDYYAFSFVRNPWDRLVSWYGMLQKHFPDERHNFKEYLLNNLGEKKSESYSNMGSVTIAQRVWCDGVDFIGRYETLYSDLNEVFKDIGLPTVNASDVPVKNVSKHRDYAQGYYTDYLKDAVAEQCVWEIEKFGYVFGE